MIKVDERSVKKIGPQEGPQTRFLSTSADVCIYGGAAGGGKSWSILYEPLRHVNVKGFNAVIFRRTMAQIMNSGSLWDASFKTYFDYPGASPLKTPRPNWKFPSGANVTFAHLEKEKTIYDYQGTEICLLEFDELTHFSEAQFWYMLSRNRSTCGIKPYVRATCNPDPDSFVAELIQWWWDPETGYAIPERSGVIRYFARVDETIKWGDSREEVLQIPGVKEAYESTKEKFLTMGLEYSIDQFILSFTFISSSIYDNKELLKANPMYLTNLQAMSLIERERLLNGNWKIRPAAGLFFKRSEANLIEELPNDIIRWARGWDLAATDVDEGGDPAYTAGVLMGKRRNGKYVIASVTNERLRSERVRKHIKNTAIIDRQKYKNVTIRLPKDPGQAGKEQAQSYIKMLSGFNVKTIAESGSKETRADPVAAQWQAGNIEVLIADWNEMYFIQMESFPEAKFKDMVDATSSAFSELESGNITSAPTGDINNAKDNYWYGR